MALVTKWKTDGEHFQGINRQGGNMLLQNNSL